MRFLAFLALFLALSGCTPKSTSSDPASGPVVSNVALALSFSGAQTGDSSYAVVSHQWILDFYPTFRSELFRRGVTKWDERFDCNHFAGYFVALAQTDFYLRNFHSATPAQSLALGSFWYIPAGQKKAGHAVVAILTERGAEFFEPQTGQYVQLTSEERSSAFVKLF